MLAGTGRGRGKFRGDICCVCMYMCCAEIKARHRTNIITYYHYGIEIEYMCSKKKCVCLLCVCTFANYFSVDFLPSNTVQLLLNYNFKKPC